MKHIISASRRTDIPHYFAGWFRNRIESGMAEFRNSFGGKGRASLKPEDVAGFLFWTKYAAPFHQVLAILRADHRPYAFQYTITGFGGSPIEPHIPKPAKAIADFLAVREGLPGSRSIQWRYDPIVFGGEFDETHHLNKFREIARELAGATTVVNVSFIEPYLKSIRRLGQYDSIQFRPLDADRHKSACRHRDQIPQVSATRGGRLLLELSDCAREHGMELRVCSNPEFGLQHAQCIGRELFEDYPGGIVNHLAPTPCRPACHCLQTYDIGMDNTCIGGCKYCYVVVSQELALKNFKSHDPTAAMMRQSAANHSP